EQADFLRARRRAILARLATRLRLEPGDVEVILPYEEVIDALGFVSERVLGLKVVPISAIVGTVDRERDFDRHFRPTSGRVRSRWGQIASAMRRGEALPPVDLYKIGEIYFVRDGHHRASVACALGHADLDPYVTQVVTRGRADRQLDRNRGVPARGGRPLPPAAHTQLERGCAPAAAGGSRSALTTGRRSAGARRPSRW